MTQGKKPKFREPNGALLSGGQQEVFQEVFDLGSEPVSKKIIKERLGITESNLNRRLTSIRVKLGSDAIVVTEGSVTLGNVNGMTVGLRGSLVQRKSKER